MTFVKAVTQAGLIPVRNMNIRFCGLNIVSTTKDKKYGRAQHEAAPGLYVLTHSRTSRKKKFLDRISTALNLEWRIEIID